MSKIVIITDTKDIHADKVISFIPKKLVNRINLDYYEKTFLSNFEFNKKINTKLNSFHIKSFLLRRLFVDQEDIVRSKKIDSGFKNYISQQRNEGFKNFLYLLEKNIPGFNTLSSIELARSKILQIKVASYLNFNIPRTFVGNNYEELKKFTDQKKINNKLIIKPLIGLGWYYKKKYFKINPQFFDLKNIKKRNFVLFPVTIQEYIPEDKFIAVSLVCPSDHK